MENQKQHYGGILACASGLMLLLIMVVTIFVKFEEISLFLPFIFTAILGAIVILSGVLLLKNIKAGGYIALGCGIFYIIGSFIPFDSRTLFMVFSEFRLTAVVIIVSGILGISSISESNTDDKV
jgi:hypothetical protein